MESEVKDLIRLAEIGGKKSQTRQSEVFGPDISKSENWQVILLPTVIVNSAVQNTPTSVAPHS